MTQPTLTIGIAALLAGGTIGFLIGHTHSSSENPEAAATSHSNEAKIRRSSDRSLTDPAPRRVRSSTEALRQPGQSTRMQSLIDLYADMSPAQLKAESANLEHLPMGERIMASMLLFSRWAEIDPQGALAHSQSMGMAGRFVKPTVLRSWASLDPVNAAKYFSDNPDEFQNIGWGRPDGRSEADVIAREWAKADATGALAWAQSLGDNDRSSAVRSVISEMAVTDPAKAAKTVATLAPEDQARAYGEVAEQWAAQDFPAAEAWINSLSGEHQDRAMAEALETLASTDPQTAATKIDRITDPESQQSAVRDITSSWAQKDPAAAAEWLTQSDFADDSRAMRNLVSQWTYQDPDASLNFIQSQPVGKARDNAAQTYLRMNRNADPQTATTLAESISNEKIRRRNLMMTTRRWMDEDATAASAYIEQSEHLSDGHKNRLLSRNDDE